MKNANYGKKLLIIHDVLCAFPENTACDNASGIAFALLLIPWRTFFLQKKWYTHRDLNPKPSGP